MRLLEVVGVGVPDLPRLITGVERIAAEDQIPNAFIAHAGDGNTHPLVVFDPDDAPLQARAHRAYGRIMDLAQELGGTVTGEHGVGRLKRPWLVRQIGPDVLDVSAQIKRRPDPARLLRSGALFARI